MERGDKIAILGLNGAGKSTLINIITGIYHPSSGWIFYQQKEFRNLLRNNQFKIGICPAFDIYFDDLTVY